MSAFLAASSDAESYSAFSSASHVASISLVSSSEYAHLFVSVDESPSESLGTPSVLAR